MFGWQVLELVHPTPDVAQMGNALNLIAELLLLWGRYDEVEPLLIRALAIRCHPRALTHTYTYAARVWDLSIVSRTIFCLPRAEP